MSGIQVHPHDILDEGVEIVLKNINRIGSIEYVFPQVNTIFERNPNPRGNLPHNPVHDIVHGNGTFHLNLSTKEIYPNLYQKVDETVINGSDSLFILKEASEFTDYKIIPWFNLLNGDFKGNMEDNNVIDYKGEKVSHWLCPNGRDVVKMWMEIFRATKEKYGYQIYMIDRIRYPDWSGEDVNPQEIFSCFCKNCCQKMNNDGINVNQLLEEIRLIEKQMKSKKFQQGVEIFKNSHLIKQWVTFRKNSIVDFVGTLVESVKKSDPSIQFWLDLWPPSYAWFLGQDYKKLTKIVPLLKHFPYHKLGGGADVQGLINHFAKTKEEQEFAFKAFLKLFDLTYNVTYEEFKQKGFPIQFVKNENNKARKASEPSTIIYSGIQMWNISIEDFRESIKEAKMSQADDLLFYCYGWAELEFFETVRELL